MSEDFELIVNGKRYSGWKSVSVNRSIDSLAGGFELEVSDRWGPEEPWPIREEDACRLELGGFTVIDGYIDKRSLSASAANRTLTYSGRDRAAALVDNAPALSKWCFKKTNLADFAREIAEPFRVEVTVQVGLERLLPSIPKLVISPGETAFEVIRKAADDQACLVITDGRGGILITRAGTNRAAALIEGENILAASVDYDGAGRFHRYVIASQTPGTDQASGDVTSTLAEAIDDGVRRTDRVLMIAVEKGYSIEDAKRRLDWERRIRAERAETGSVTVVGWKQPDGAPWPVNAVTHLKAPRLVGADGDVRIASVSNSISEQGRITVLKLIRPDSLTPEPTRARLKASGRSAGVGWPELKNGAR
jgi:prophage tail gpP-like protein